MTLTTAALMLGTVACTEAVEEEAHPASATTQEPTGSISQAHVTDQNGVIIELPELKPSIGAHCLQIDREDRASLVNPGDARLEFDPAGPREPAECSPDINDYTDWAQLVFNGLDISQFQIKDVISGGGTKDPTAFPQGDNRVGEANVVPKQDLVEAAMAFNTIGGTVEESFVNIGLLRLGTEGSSSWFGVFTRMPNHIHGADQRLTYDIREGDVLVVGDFDPAKGDIVAVHLAVVNMDGLSAVEVASPEGQTPGGANIWGPREVDPSIVAALNTTELPLGVEGHLFDGTDVDGRSIPKNRLSKDGNFEAGAFFEVAIPLSIFVNGGLCGSVFHGTFITRPSRSRNSAMKDLLGPFRLNLGEVAANPILTPTCEGDLTFEANPQITGLPGIPDGPVPDPECTWTITCNNTVILEDYVNDCSAETLSSLSSNLLPLISTDSALDCSATVAVESTETPGCVGEDDDTTTVYPPLAVSAAVAPKCEDPNVAGFVSSFLYEVDGAGGGTGNHQFSWAFSGITGSPQDVVSGDNTSTAQSGEVLVDVATANEIYSALLTLTDPVLDAATGDDCSVTDLQQTIPLAPLAVALTLDAVAAACVADFDVAATADFDAATYRATVAGGSGLYTYDWEPDAFCDDIPAPGTTATSDTCTIDPDNATQVCGDVIVQATIDNLNPFDATDPRSDLIAECPAATTNQGTYSKTTTVDASVQ